MSDRLIVDVKVEDCYVDFGDVIDGRTPDDIIDVMKYYKERFEDRDIYFSIERYGYDGGKELVIRERRLENDKEYDRRIAEEKRTKEHKKKLKAAKEAEELAQYLKLKKKFDKV